VDGENNSGVQYRSKRKKPKAWGVVGYQMDIHSKPEYTAMLYGEGTGRGIIALQVHQGAPMTVYFKDIVLERLPSETR